MSASTGSPRLLLSRYFLSQMSCEAGCIAMTCSASDLTISRRTVLISGEFLLCLLVERGGPIARCATCGWNPSGSPTLRRHALLRAHRDAWCEPASRRLRDVRHHDHGISSLCDHVSLNPA